MLQLFKEALRKFVIKNNPRRLGYKGDQGSTCLQKIEVKLS